MWDGQRGRGASRPKRTLSAAARKRIRHHNIVAFVARRARGVLSFSTTSNEGELFPRVGFIVTNLSLPSRAVVRFYNMLGRESESQGTSPLPASRRCMHVYFSRA